MDIQQALLLALLNGITLFVILYVDRIGRGTKYVMEEPSSRLETISKAVIIAATMALNSLAVIRLMGL